MNRQEHWNGIYMTKGEQDLSWFEVLPDVSLKMMEAAGLTAKTYVIDVGGGDSRLVDHLVAKGLECLAALDVSGAALQRAQARLGAVADTLVWIESDVADGWTLKPMDIWHDRAVFHFLIAAEDRRRYHAHLRQTLKPGGSVILATFALDGPPTCSGSTRGAVFTRVAGCGVWRGISPGRRGVVRASNAVGQQAVFAILTTQAVAVIR